MRKRRIRIDREGNLVSGGHFRYDAFGNLAEGDTGLTRYLYTAREFDPVTGLQYNLNRWYDPRLGRFLSEDPMRESVADMTAVRTQDPHVAFFVERNPGHAQGDELCCLARLSRDNFTDAAYRVVESTS